MTKSIRMNLLAVTFATASLFLYQNCGTGFKSSSLEATTLSESSATAGENPSPPPTSNPAPSPLPNPQPGVQPSPTPNPVSIKTYFYFGRASGIDVLSLDSATSKVTTLPSVAFSGNSVGWLAYEPKSNLVFAPDTGSVNRLQIYKRDSTNGNLASVKSFLDFPQAIVHLSVAPTATGFDLFGASYNNGILGAYKVDSALNTGQSVQEIGFPTGAKTHSSAFDSKRNLLFIANLGLNKISVYRVNAGGLTALNEISITSPRTVVYDSSYDKIFVATEASTGSSSIRIYGIEANANSYVYPEQGSLAMPLSGSDLKVNHQFRYVMAAAREAGKESIWGLPITDKGIADTSRKAFSISVTQKMPRALEITEDGRFLMIASQVADNIQAYKLSFDSNLGFVSSQKIFDQKIGNQGYLCGLSVP